MKRIAVIAACAFLTLPVFAGSTNKRSESPTSRSGMGVIHHKASVFKLFYKSEESADVKVEIIDANSAIVFTETIRKSDGFVRPYNFAMLPEGRYTIKVDNGSNWMIERIEYRTGRLVSPSAQVVTLREGKFLLVMAGREDEHFSVSVSGKTGDVIYHDDDAVAGSSAKLFNFKKIEGPFRFDITGPHGYAKTITKD